MHPSTQKIIFHSLEEKIKALYKRVISNSELIAITKVYVGVPGAERRKPQNLAGFAACKSWGVGFDGGFPGAEHPVCEYVLSGRFGAVCAFGHVLCTYALRPILVCEPVFVGVSVDAHPSKAVPLSKVMTK